MTARPYVVALTGGIGSGKTTVAEGFAAHGIEVVDADRIAHQLSGPQGAAIAAITASFGSGVLDAQGALDRAAMRVRVFSDPSARMQLEGILHPMIGVETEAAIARARSPYVMWVVPLFFEAKGPRRFRPDRILVVDCAEETQIRRVMARSSLSRSEVEAIMASQVTRSARLEGADDVLENDNERSSLDAAIAQLHMKFLAFAQSTANQRL